MNFHVEILQVSLHTMFGDVEINPLKIIICNVSGPN